MNIYIQQTYATQTTPVCNNTNNQANSLELIRFLNKSFVRNILKPFTYFTITFEAKE